MNKYPVFATLVILGTLVMGGAVTFAGSLTPPGSVENTMYTLDDLYAIAVYGATATLGSGAIAASPGSASATFHTLTEIYDAVASIARAQVLKTGQTTCYNGNSNDGWAVAACTSSTDEQDGDIDSRRGLVRSYTDNGDGTITDNSTRLMWQKCSVGLSGGSCATGVVSTLDWNTATSTCAALTLAGHSDWHLPDQFELYSLVNLGTSNPAIDTTYFPATVLDNYWSSTSSFDDPNNAWIVYFSDGYTYYVGKTAMYPVRCVRQNS